MQTFKFRTIPTSTSLNLEEDFQRPLNPVVLDKAIDLILGDITPTPEIMRKLTKFVENSFKHNHCCVMYSVSPKFKKLCNSLNIDTLKREVIITSGMAILFSDNFLISPKLMKVN